MPATTTLRRSLRNASSFSGAAMSGSSLGGNQSECVLPHDAFDAGVVEAGDALDVLLGHMVALGVGPVRAHEHVVDTDQVGQPDHVLLGERRDVHVLLEHLGGAGVGL